MKIDRADIAIVLEIDRDIIEMVIAQTAQVGAIHELPLLQRRSLPEVIVSVT